MKTVLPKEDILRLIRGKPPLIEGYIALDEQLQPNGFDLTLREVARIKTPGCVGVSNAQRAISDLSPLAFDQEDFLNLASGPYVITFNEIVNLPENIMALGAPRSSLLRCGVTVQNAVWDAGYSGRSRALMIVHDLLGFRIQRNARIDQLVFFELASRTEGYRGAYQGENIG